jgi:hypothetical protein
LAGGGGAADAIGAPSGHGEEGVQVLADTCGQERVGGSTWEVRSHSARPSGFRAVPTARRCPADDGCREVVASSCNIIATKRTRPFGAPRYVE